MSGPDETDHPAIFIKAVAFDDGVKWVNHLLFPPLQVKSRGRRSVLLDEGGIPKKDVNPAAGF